MSFLGEIKRRKVFQVAVVYAVVTWVLVQIIDVVNDPLSLPPWFDTVAILLLLLGFPLAMILTWAFDITPAGVVRTPASDLVTEPDVPVNAPHQPIQSPEQVSPSPPAGSEELPHRMLRNSVAVLPLENLSPNPDDAYFAAGIHEEILNYLTKIKDLSVIARTSVKKYANTDKTIAEIAGELGVGTVMEGSVRYAGERVRVTAQLIDAVTEDHLWSEIYERGLADVFAIQADIAAKIAEALEAELSVVEKASIEALPSTSSSEAHALYLRSQALFGQDDTALAVTAPPSIRASIKSNLDQAIEFDPEFATLYALKALISAASRIYDPIKDKDWLKRSAELDESVRVNADKALTLNANLGLPHLAMALNHQFNWRGAQARGAYERALELRPNDSNVLGWYATLKWFTEEFDDAIHLAEKAVALDPGNAYTYAFLALILHAAGDYRASADTFEKFSTLHPGSSLPYLLRGRPDLALGNEAHALEGLRLADQLIPDEAAPAIHIEIAYAYERLGQREDAKKVINKVEAMIGDRFVDPIVQVWANLAIGDHGQALQWLKQSVEKPEYRQEVFVRTFIKENAWSDPVLDQPEFVALRDRLRFRE